MDGWTPGTESNQRHSKTCHQYLIIIMDVRPDNAATDAESKEFLLSHEVGVGVEPTRLKTLNFWQVSAN